MAYKVIILYQLYMPSYFLGTFTEYPLINPCFLAPKIIAATHMITPKPFTISDIVVHKFKVLNPEETAAVNV